MSGAKKLVGIVAVAALTAAVGVASQQVLNGDKLSFIWACVALALAVLAALCTEAFSTGAPADAGGDHRTAGEAVRGRRRFYLRQLRSNVCDMETIGIVTQPGLVLDLERVYVDVSLALQAPHNTATEPYVGRIRLSPGERRTLASFIDGDDCGHVFAVIGGPGSGKTTLMRSTALQLCRGRLRRRGLPILVYLRDHAAAILADDPPGLAAVAADAGWVTGTTPPSWIERRLDRGGCLVMLDGLDEVADEADRATVVAWVRRQIERHPRNTYLITSRPHGYLSNPLPNANVLQVRRFTPEQISQFLHHWYYATECRARGATGKKVRDQAASKADDLLGRLRSRPGLYDLAANPLLLTMIANVHLYRGALPGSRAALYAEMCDVLVHRRQESKGLPDQTGLRGPQKAHIVRGLALAMMLDRVRDVSVADACRIIAADLRDTAPEMNPADFLDEVRKSGLLVEREHGRYAFAHLTLQEYLAASHLGQRDAKLLADKVDDPWWRETTLLWAADADATPIITACLASGTIRALELSFDCADEARAIGPGAREQLKSLDTADAERRRLIKTAKAARSLREVIWLNDDTVICARPVTNGLYRLFALDERAAGLHTPVPGADEDAPAVGMWAGDVARFTAWLNGLFNDGDTYRLPTAEELADPVTDLTRHTVWTQTASRPGLYRPDGAAWPYAADPGRLQQTLTADRELMSPYLRLTFMKTESRERVLAHSRVFAAALALAPELSGRPDLSMLRLVLHLALARALNHIRTSTVVPIHALDHALELAVDRALDLDRDLAVELDLARAHDREIELALARALDRTLDRALPLARDLTAGLALDLDLALDLAVAQDLDLALDRDLPRALDLDLPRTSALDLPRALARARDLELALALDRDMDRARDLAGALDRDLAGAVDHALDRDLTRNLDLEPALDRARSRALARAHDRARANRHLDHDLARDFAADAVWSQTVMGAFQHLLTLWSPHPRRSRKAEAEEVLADFDAFLTSILSVAPAEADPPPEDPPMSLRRARDLLDGPPRHPVSDRARAQRDEARRLIDQVHDLIAPILDRTAPADGRALASVRMGLLAVLGLLRSAGDADAAAPVLQSLRSLIALDQRANGHLVPNEILLLVRA